MERYLEQINKLPTSAKAGILAAVALLVTVGTYFFVIDGLNSTIDGLVAQEASLSQQLAEKQNIADNLADKRKEMERLDQQLAEALTQMPTTKDIEELLAQLNDVGKKSGLDIGRYEPGPEAAENSFISRIPIKVVTKGNYHEIARFMQEMSTLRRVVNVSDIKLAQPTLVNDKVLVNGEFVVTTFRFSEQKSDKKGAK